MSCEHSVWLGLAFLEASLPSHMLTGGGGAIMAHFLEHCC